MVLGCKVLATSYVRHSITKKFGTETVNLPFSGKRAAISLPIVFGVCNDLTSVNNLSIPEFIWASPSIFLMTAYLQMTLLVT